MVRHHTCPQECLLKDSKIPGLCSFHSAAVITHSDVKQLRVKASLWQNPPLRVQSRSSRQEHRAEFPEEGYLLAPLTCSLAYPLAQRAWISCTTQAILTKENNAGRRHHHLIMKKIPHRHAHRPI